MGQGYNVTWNKTNTASATVPMGSLFATATRAPRIYEFNSGSDASADNAVKYGNYRESERGTPSNTGTPNNVDQNCSAASSTFDTAWNINPTVTASSQVMVFPHHQRATYRWVAYDYTKMLQTQAGTGNGLAWMSDVVSSAFNGVFQLFFEE